MKKKDSQKNKQDLSKYAGQWVAIQTFKNNYRVVGSGARLKDISHLITVPVDDPRLSIPGRVPAAFKVPAK